VTEFIYAEYFLKGLCQWLSKCFASVKWSSCWSFIFSVSFGVRQGSVLSPVLFIYIYIHLYSPFLVDNWNIQK